MNITHGHGIIHKIETLSRDSSSGGDIPIIIYQKDIIMPCPVEPAAADRFMWPGYHQGTGAKGETDFYYPE